VWACNLCKIFLLKKPGRYIFIYWSFILNQTSLINQKGRRILRQKKIILKKFMGVYMHHEKAHRLPVFMHKHRRNTRPGTTRNSISNKKNNK
jgi:hypothetical protein